MARLKESDAGALDLLFGRYARLVMGIALRTLDDYGEAEDVVQEAFLHAYQALDSFKGDSLFFTWLYRIAVNTAISLKRKQRSVLSLHAGRNGEVAAVGKTDFELSERPARDWTS